ncbi:MAG: 50S ribosomal protein L6 [Gammaproteobacteria bacterium]|nr:50S ribosomal protein L6 [Gammaproteobacteria bacterium]MCI0590916.1 50S ribosomal protein L6 [Gammaproteobacteria bacterium]
MSRIANRPINIPAKVEVSIDGRIVTVKGPKGTLDYETHPLVKVNRQDNSLTFSACDESKAAKALSGTTRAILNNMVTGVLRGFERKLQIIGVGYRAQIQGKVLDLSVGTSHPIKFKMPDGVTIDTPSPTEIVIRGYDKQKVSQAAAQIRAYQPPEPYKGKGIRYLDEMVVRKEAKKS